MSITDAVQTCFQKYATFSGRARRSELWYFTLCYVIVEFVLGAIGAKLRIVAVLAGLLSLACIIPSLAVAVRRLHDIGKKGTWLLIGFVPVAGPILLLYWYTKDSQPGVNEFGPNPKEADAKAAGF